MSMNLMAIENKNNTRRRRPKWEVLHQFALGKSPSSSFYFVCGCVCLCVRESSFHAPKPKQFSLFCDGEACGCESVDVRLGNFSEFRSNTQLSLQFFIISWWWRITHVADELCRVPTKQSFVCVDSWLHRKSSVLSLCAACYFYLLATSEFRSASGYTSKFFSKLVLSASLLLWCVIWPKSIKSV